MICSACLLTNLTLVSSSSVAGFVGHLFVQVIVDNGLERFFQLNLALVWLRFFVGKLECLSFALGGEVASPHTAALATSMCAIVVPVAIVSLLWLVAIHLLWSKYHPFCLLVLSIVVAVLVAVLVLFLLGLLQLLCGSSILLKVFDLSLDSNDLFFLG